MLKLASVEILLVVFAIYGKEIIRNCYEDYQECIPEGNKTDHINVENVESHNLIEFCSDHTQNILPCLATKLGLTKSMSVSTFSLLLATCDAETHNNRSATKEEQQTLKHLARLYAYLCAFSNIMDLHYNTECFRYLVKRCVLNKPDDSCMFYHCEKVNLNLSRPSRQILSTHKYETTEIVDSVDHPTQLIILKNHQDRTTPVVTILITFIGMIQ